MNDKEKRPRPISEILRELQGTESQEAFAARLGISQSLLSRMIRLNYVPKPSTIKRMVENLGIENTPLGQELLVYASFKTRKPSPKAPTAAVRDFMGDKGAALVELGAQIIARYYEQYLRTLLERAPAPEITLGGEELLVLAPIETSVEHPFAFQWVHSLLLYYDSSGEPRREEPEFYKLIVKCADHEWQKDVPASSAPKVYSPYLGKEERIISVHSTEPEFGFEDLPAGCRCSWEVQAFSAQEELMGSSGEINFKIFDPRAAMLSELDYFLLGLLLESAERFDEAARMYQKIVNERQRNLVLLGMFERRLERLEEEIERLEAQGGDETRVEQLKKGLEPLRAMANLYRAKVRESLRQEG